MENQPELPNNDHDHVRSSQWVAAFKSGLKEVIQLVLIVVVLRVGLDIFIPRYIVDGASMQPSFYTSERVIIDRLTMLLGGPSRGDVIVLDSPRSDDDLLIKRVIGLPGETVVMKEGRVYVDGVLLDEPYVMEYCSFQSCNGEWQLGPDEYFILGDNRNHSLDSHSFGPVSRSSIIGIARVRYWPPTEFEVFDSQDY
ncbi:MAG: signal peptidase I [Anaerolineae bacterium]|jgi:signal peptidase I|nr:signal peptidase I [Anaerolineae bacterium]